NSGMNTRLRLDLLLAAVIAAAFLVGCATPAEHVKVGVIDGTTRTENKGAFDVIRPGQQIARPFREIAVLTYDAGAGDEADAMTGLVLRARQLGADGLILGQAVAPNQGLRIVHPFFVGQLSARVFRGSAIVYTDQR